MLWIVLLLLFGLTVKLVKLVPSTLEDVYCSKASLTWRHGMEECQRVNGSIVYLDRDLLDQNIVSPNVTIWTPSYTRRTYEKGQQHELCAFTYIDGSIRSWTDDILFTSCDSNKSYICKDTNETGWEIHRGSYEQAAECIHPYITVITYLDSSQINSTGYYWINKHIQQEEHTLQGDVRFIFTPSLCGIYAADTGYCYGSCCKKYRTLCRLQKSHPDFNKECLNLMNHVTNSSISRGSHAQNIFHCCPKLRIVVTDLDEFESSSINSQTSGYSRSVILLNEMFNTSSPEVNSTPLTSDNQHSNADMTDTGKLVGLTILGAVCVVMGVVVVLYMIIRNRRTFHFNINHDMSTQQGTILVERFISTINDSFDIVESKTSPHGTGIERGPTHSDSFKQTRLSNNRMQELTVEINIHDVS